MINLGYIINLMFLCHSFSVSVSAMTIGALDRARGPDIPRRCVNACYIPDIPSAVKHRTYSPALSSGPLFHQIFWASSYKKSCKLVCYT